MTEWKKPRVMWLLNHGAARKFELAMLKEIGIEEIFLPKKWPDDISFRSASVDYSEDANLTIPPHELAILNNQNWYLDPSQEAWEIANRYFDIMFFIVHEKNILRNIAKNYKGIILWRAYGTIGNTTYTKILDLYTNSYGKHLLNSIKNRFYFAEAYDHLHLIEDDFLKKRALSLPLGMHDPNMNDNWKGSNKSIFFVCPDLGFNSYYQEIYRRFVKDFKGLTYAIGGAQPLSIADPNVLGYLPKEDHERNMREMRVMFYHSAEPNHIHYHPFEAIKVGMPLIFMAGGLLDRLGGKDLPGRCKNIKEARRKIERILNDDWKFIEKVRKSQACLLDPMKAQNCSEAWRTGFQTLFQSLEKTKKSQAVKINKPKRIAVILPAQYKGGTFRAAKLLAQAIEIGARQDDQNVEVFFCYLEDFYTAEDLFDLPRSIKRRPFSWSVLEPAEVKEALLYAGLELTLKFERCCSVNDKINHLADCDLLLMVSDRLSLPLMPIKPYILIVYDYLQRYEKITSSERNLNFINTAHLAERVLVTTEFTRNDALQFAGLPHEKVVKVPMLAPVLSSQRFAAANEQIRKYFLWTTNMSAHKNHENSLKALLLYYEKYDGQLECHVTGVDTANLINNENIHLKQLPEIIKLSNKLAENLKFLGNLSDEIYQLHLETSTFLWHPCRIDNGTFAVIEAAHLGVPALSSDYPAMREIDEQFQLNLNWMNAYDPEDMAIQLKKMEVEENSLRLRVPSAEILSNQSVEKLSPAYWEEIKKCL